jgi:Predicted transcriptional regulators
MNMILLMSGYPPAIIRKSDRLAYIGSLEKAQLGGSKDDYVKIITKAVDRSLDIYLKAAVGEDAGPADGDRLLKIGDLAKRVGESNSTIRHWTKEGLLQLAEITDAGYQLYAPDMVERVRQINALKKQRFTLREIKEKIT